MEGRSRVLLLVCVMCLTTVPPLAAQQVSRSEIVWPAPPEEPRIRYVGTLRSEADIGKGESFFGKLKRTVVGGERPQMLSVERPFDVYVSDGSRIYVTNGLLPAVTVFDKSEKKGRLLGEDVPGGFRKPMGLGGDSQGKIYVADPGLRRVVVLGPDGQFVRVFGGAASLLNPVDVAADDEAGRFYVVDSYLHEVVVFDAAGEVIDRIGKKAADLSLRERSADMAAGLADSDEETSSEANQGDDLEGEVGQHGPKRVSSRDMWENRGSGEGEFRYPMAAAVGPDGTLYVTDQMNFRVQAFNKSGHFLRQFGRLGDHPGSFTRPKGVAVDSDGHIYVVDASFSNVQVFDADGRLLIAFGSLGHGEGKHWLPLGVSIDQSDRIYVADRFNNRTQIYQYLPLSSDSQAIAERHSGSGSGGEEDS